MIWWESKNPIVKFAISFFVLLILFYSIYGRVWFFQSIIEPLTFFYAEVTSTFLNIIGYETTSHQSSVISDLITLNIRLGCDGLEATALFLIAIFAMKTNFNQKMRGIAIGLPILFLANLIRIFSLFFIGIYFPSLFDFFHLQFWQVAFMLIAGVLWFIWAKDLFQFSNSDLKTNE